MTDAWWDGYMDYKAREDENPYPSLSQEWYDWFDGYGRASEEENAN